MQVLEGDRREASGAENSLVLFLEHDAVPILCIT